MEYEDHLAARQSASWDSMRSMGGCSMDGRSEDSSRGASFSQAEENESLQSTLTLVAMGARTGVAVHLVSHTASLLKSPADR